MLFTVAIYIGIPGHTHGEEEEEEHSDDEESVFADLEQTKVQLLGEYNLDNKWLNKVNLRVGHTDYEHAEIEGGAVGTTFKNETNELRIDLQRHLQFQRVRSRCGQRVGLLCLAIYYLGCTHLIIAL